MQYCPTAKKQAPFLLRLDRELEVTVICQRKAGAQVLQLSLGPALKAAKRGVDPPWFVLAHEFDPLRDPKLLNDPCSFGGLLRARMY